MNHDIVLFPGISIRSLVSSRPRSSAAEEREAGTSTTDEHAAHEKTATERAPARR